MNEGWLCDSILNTAQSPSPISTAPAFSPGPWTTRGPVVGSFFKCTRELLYEQCSDHITENMPNSVKFGSRPSISTIFLYSSSVRLCCAMRSLVITTACMNQLLQRSDGRGTGAQETGKLQYPL